MTSVRRGKTNQQKKTKQTQSVSISTHMRTCFHRRLEPLLDRTVKTKASTKNNKQSAIKARPSRVNHDSSARKRSTNKLNHTPTQCLRTRYTDNK